MIRDFKKHTRLYICALFFIFVVVVWYVVLNEGYDRRLTVAFLDVGQGDAIFIEAPNGNQVLIDGGPDKSVLRELSSVMPFYDRSIDMVVASHPDKDHVSGLPEVLKRYDIGVVAESGAEYHTSVYKEFVSAIKEKNISHIVARRGQRVILDDGVFLDILFPDRDVAGWDTNDASIVARLVYGGTSFMLTGDSPQKMEKYLVSLDREALHSTVLKLGHHGSKTSSSAEFVGYVSPEYAVVSAGEGNRYGHPHKEVLDTMERFNVTTLSTIDAGSIIFKSDGETIEQLY